jgi:hypothetical protein
MIRSLRAFFLGRLLREKLLLMAFIVIGLLWWLSAFTARANQFYREQRSTTAALKEQQMWIDNRLSIEQRAQQAAAQLQPEKTLDGLRLQSAVNQAAYEAGMRNNYTTTSGGRETNGQFTVNTVNFRATNVGLDLIEKFYHNLQKRAPYISIENFVLQANRATPAMLTAEVRVSSVEVARVEK